MAYLQAKKFRFIWVIIFSFGLAHVAHADFLDAVLSPNPDPQEILNNTPTREQQMLDALNSVKMPNVKEILRQSAENSITIDVRPEYPGPNNDATVSLFSYSTDLGISNISWYINGTLIDRGPGLRELSFKTGGSGEISAIRAVVTTPTGETYEKTLTVYPSAVELAWEALTYTPPFYKGKALASPGSIIRVVAIPHLTASNGKEIAPENLGYTWSHGNTADQKASGLGKYVYYADGPALYLGAPIKVRAYSTDNVLVAEGTITIPPTQPKVLFYQTSPLSGIEYGRALSGTFDAPDSEVTLKAEPYFFSMDNLSFKWSMDGKQLPSATSTTITIGESGNIQALFGNLSRNVQTAAASLKIQLPGGLFGGF